MEDKFKFVEEKLKFILDCFRIKDLKLKLKYDKNSLYIEIFGEDIDFLTVDNGKLINSLQYILTIIVNLNFDSYLRIILDSNDFRKKRNDYIINLCEKLKNQVLEKKHSITLEPMNPFERRIVHSYISGLEGVYSKSVGVDPNRSVVIYPGYSD